MLATLVVLSTVVGAPVCKDCSEVTLQHGVDFLNTDGQSSSHATSIQECCSICKLKPGCQAFTYRADQHSCYTKADAANPVKNPLATSGNCGPPPPPPGYLPKCLGEFAPCPGGNHCTMGACGSCKHGQYLCPSDRTTCIDGPEDYESCPGMKGTHFDTSLSIEQRIDYLLNATTLDDQISQLQNKAPALPELGIPFYNWLNDDQHGVGRTSAKATVFPNGCGLGATFSKELLYSAGQVLGEEARGLHNYFLHNQSNRGENCNGCGMTIYGPNLNLVKDPRWGRGQETYGEDPHLMARLVVAWVTGAQNNSAGDSVGPDGKHLQSGLCCKHFAVYNIENLPTARQQFDANVTSQSMWETYMPAFEACIKEAKATHVMCSYNSVNGVPTCGSKGLLTEILRDQWDFDGFVVSDYDAWADIKSTHNYAATYEDAAAIGINAGLDQEGGGTQAINQLSQAIADGKTTKLAVATSFRRLFRVRIRLGMLDPPLSVPYNALNETEAQSPAHMEIALKTALASMTLLKNDNKALPLSKSELAVSISAGAGAGGPTVAIIGPQATMAGLLMGNYAESASKGNWGTPVLDAVKAVVGEDAVVQANGCSDISCGDKVGFPAALIAAASAKVIVVMLGLDFNGGDADESEGHDRNAIELPGNQGLLVERLRAANPKKTIIGLLVHGGTLALGSAGDKLDAIMSAWYPGIGGGPAIAQTLFGESNPAGRTASTWYNSTEDLTAPEEQNESEGKGMTYRYIKNYRGAVVYPFGHGLSYTTFSYSKLSVNAGAASTGPCDAITVTVTVTNTGSVDGDEVIQVYAQTPDATVPTARIRLVAFDRIFIKAGASATVTLAVLPDSHSVVYPSADVYHDTRQVEAGRVVLSVGGGQPDYYAGSLTATVKVLGGKPLNSCPPGSSKEVDL